LRCKDNYYFRSSKKILNFSTIFKWLLARRELSLCKLVVKDKFRMINKFQFDIRLIFATLNGKVSAAIYQQLQKNFTKNGIPITPDGWTILIYLWEKDGVKQQDLCDATFKDKPSMTRLLDSMEEQHLVVRISQKKDRRTNLIYLTKTGRDLEVPIRKITEETLTEALKGVNSDDLMICQEVMKQIFRNTTGRNDL
jgi:MarR family transcriptional regulator, organic hydroperoxide resistance regulator